MDVILLMIVCGLGYLVAYYTYGRFLAKKIFKLDPNRQVPSQGLNDGIDYVPTKKGIIFGHHYTSIAGTGPIVGPAIGVIWGWLPAILWVLLGSIFMGAVHDFGALIVSLRNQGKSISEIAAKYINARVRFIFFFIVFLSLLIVIAIFGVVIAAVFSRFPSSVVPVWLQIPIAMTLGYMVYKKSANILLSSIVAVIAMYLSIWLGAYLTSTYPAFEQFLTSETILGLPPTGLWTIILLMYAWVASTLPVTTLLQPRDYINAWQLFIAMTLLVAGAVVAAFTQNLSLVAPAINTSLPADTPPLWPFMFVIIACGAISGFHSLVASGTSCKQVAREPDSLFIGYGSMLLEGVLATLVIICATAGIGLALEIDGSQLLVGKDAWNHFYSSWMGQKGLTDKIAPVIFGAANMFKSLNIPQTIGITLMGVFIASFAGTTLDTAVRIQRYIISELATDLKIKPLKNKWSATTFAVLTAAMLAFVSTENGQIVFGADGKGAMTLWPLFGTANQLLASLAFLVITMYLRKKGGLKFLVTAIPCLIILTIAIWAMIKNEIAFIEKENWLLVTIGAAIFSLAIWMVIETLIVFFRHRPQQQASPNLQP